MGWAGGREQFQWALSIAEPREVSGSGEGSSSQCQAFLNILHLFPDTPKPLWFLPAHYRAWCRAGDAHLSSSSSRAEPVLSQSAVAWGLSVSLQGCRELPASPDLGDLVLPLLLTKDWALPGEEERSQLSLGCPLGAALKTLDVSGEGFLEAYRTKLRLEKESGVRASVGHSAAVLC